MATAGRLEEAVEQLSGAPNRYCHWMWRLGFEEFKRILYTSYFIVLFGVLGCEMHFWILGHLLSMFQALYFL